LENHLRRRQRARSLDGGVRGQTCRPLEQRRSCWETTPTLRASCSAFQLGGHGFFRFGSREGTVPGATLSGELGITHLGERVVDTPSFIEGRGSINRRAHQGMVESNAGVNVQ
jgi:hypothetical protein